MVERATPPKDETPRTVVARKPVPERTEWSCRRAERALTVPLRQVLPWRSGDVAASGDGECRRQRRVSAVRIDGATNRRRLGKALAWFWPRHVDAVHFESASDFSSVWGPDLIRGLR